LHPLKQFVPALRAEARPVGYLIKAINFPLNKLLYKPKNIDNQKTNPKKLDGLLFNKLLKDQQNEYSTLKDSLIIKQNFNELRKYVNILEENHCRLIFFEMPVDLSLRDLPRAIYIRKNFFKYFPTCKYVYMTNSNEVYFTIDGIHLTDNSTLKYTHYFKNFMKNEKQIY